MLFRTLIPILAALQLAGATALGSARRVDTTGLERALVRRQTSNVPTQCQAGCNPVNTQLTNGCSPQQCCTSSFETAYFDCFVCVGNSINLTDYSSAQSVLDSFLETCAMDGISIPKLTFPGQDANRPLSTVAGSSTAGASSAGTSSSSTLSRTTVTQGPTTSNSQSVVTSLTTLPTSSAPFTQKTITSLSTGAPATSSQTTSTTGLPVGGNTSHGMRFESCMLSVPVLFVSLAVGWIL